MKNNNSQVVSFGENCCTPVGQIKRYVDCIGCDRKPKLIHQQIIDLAGGEERCKELLGINPKQEIDMSKYISGIDPYDTQETLEEAAETLYPINNTGGMFMPNREEVKNIYRQEGFIAGVKSDAARDYWFEQFKKK